MKRVGVVLLLIASAVGVGAPAAARPGQVGAGTEVRIAAEGFGPGATGIGDYATRRSTADEGVASSSYQYPPPSWTLPGAWWSCGSDGCSGWSASAHSGVDVAAGVMTAFAQSSIYTGGTAVSTAGFSQVSGRAYIDDTITLSEPATVTLEGQVHVRLASAHSHHGWYGDPEAVLDVDLGFRTQSTGGGEWDPWDRLGGYDESFVAPLLNACPYPATCFGDPSENPGPRQVVRPFSVEVELPAGTSAFNATMLADIDILVWGARGDEHRSAHGASALIDGANTLEFEIQVPEGIVATSGSGLLPIVGGGTTTPGDTTPPTITCDEPPSGWQAGNVTLGCSAVDAGAGLADPSDASFALTTTVPAGVETSDAATDHRVVCDAAGNCATAGPVSGLQVDRRAPAVSYQGNLGVYEIGDHVEIRCVAEDLGSGIASDTCEDILGPASSFVLGLNTFSATAVDAVGNEGTASTSFHVVGATQGLDDLVRQFVDHPGVQRALLAKLDAASQAPDEHARAGQLAAFVNQVRAQTGKALTPAQAQVLEQLAGQP